MGPFVRAENSQTDFSRFSLERSQYNVLQNMPPKNYRYCDFSREVEIKRMHVVTFSVMTTPLYLEKGHFISA